jgi:hypothetical protein
MEALLEDLCKVLHDLEWETSGDYGTGAYRRSVEQFKAKWIGRPAPILRDVIIQEMRLMQARLLTAYEALGYDRAQKQKDIQKWFEKK